MPQPLASGRKESSQYSLSTIVPLVGRDGLPDRYFEKVNDE